MDEEPCRYMRQVCPFSLLFRARATFPSPPPLNLGIYRAFSPPSSPLLPPHLGAHVHKRLPPLHVTGAHEGEGDRGVEVAARDVAERVDGRDEGEAVGSRRRGVLVGRGTAEHLEQEGAPKLCAQARREGGGGGPRGIRRRHMAGGDYSIHAHAAASMHVMALRAWGLRQESGLAGRPPFMCVDGTMLHIGVLEGRTYQRGPAEPSRF